MFGNRMTSCNNKRIQASLLDNGRCSTGVFVLVLYGKLDMTSYPPKVQHCSLYSRTRWK